MNSESPALVAGQVVIYQDRPARVLWASAGRVCLEIAWGPVVTVRVEECQPTEQRLVGRREPGYWPTRLRDKPEERGDL